MIEQQCGEFHAHFSRSDRVPQKTCFGSEIFNLNLQKLEMVSAYYQD